MIKIGYKIDLSPLKIEELLFLKRLNILSKKDVEQELTERGISPHEILLKLREQTK